MDTSNEQFSLIYDQYIDKIYRFVYLKVSTKEIAEDITSKVFLKGFEAFQKNQKIDNIGAFLYQIARNSIADHYRASDKTNIVGQENIPELIDTKAGVYEKALLNSEIDTVKNAIFSLKKEYQDVLIWHYLEDMSAEQIALIVNKPAGTVRVTIHRGLKALKDKLVHES